ncbi:MAG TPA: acetate--CoA ligase family protein [Nitrososphaerales archaeon]|nr:acetate--CoA ligase family protein [Nitrososphaerales archaeon]
MQHSEQSSETSVIQRGGRKVPSKAKSFIDAAVEARRTSLLEYEAEQVAKQYRIPVAKGGLATTEKQAVLLARGIGLPVVMKIVSPDILHKSDVGGVIVNLNSFPEVRKAFAEIMRNAKRANRKAEIKGVYVQKMAPKSYEFVVGGLRDPQFGPTVMFGLGGIYVEIFKDVSFRIAPVSEEDAQSMMKEIKSSQLLTGFRGSKPLDTKAAALVLQAVGQIMFDFEEIDSIDINPLFIYPRGVMATDVRIILKKPPERKNDQVH